MATIKRFEDLECWQQKEFHWFYWLDWFNLLVKEIETERHGRLFY